MKIVIPEHPYLTKKHESQLKTLGEVTIYQDIPSEEEIIERIAGADLITASWTDITRKIIKSNPNLKFIIALGVGYDNVDSKTASEAGIKIINCPTHNGAAVAEYTIALILTITKKIIPANMSLRDGKWDKQIFLGTELDGKKLSLIGYGNIGRKVTSLATNFGMEVSHSNSKTPPNELDDLIANADILSLHLPLTKQTKHLLDERRLKLMKPSAYLINTARGAIVDQKALLKVLQEKRIAGAALDVFEDEPVIGNASEEIQQLSQLDNVVATPHIAYNTEETAVRLGEELIANIEACLKGSPINIVN